MHTFFCFKFPLHQQAFIKETYPEPEDLPQIGFYDSACRLRRHLDLLPPEEKKYWEGRIKFLVDEFHWANHKDDDEYCQKHCNPKLQPKTRTKDGKSRFNTSAAEMNNSWAALFLPLCRGMSAVRYDFFMHEMVLLKNEAVCESLRNRVGVTFVDNVRFRPVQISELMGQ